MTIHHTRSYFVLTALSILATMLLVVGGCGGTEPVATPQRATSPDAANDLPDSAASQTLVTLRGRVADEDGNPVAGALICGLGRKLPYLQEQSDVETDANGVFRFELDSRHLDFSSLYCYAITHDQTRLGDGRLELKEGETAIPEMEITVKPCPIITGTVIDKNGMPVESATVAVQDSVSYLNVVSTDAEGKFKSAYERFGIVPPVYAYKEGVGFDYLSRKEIEKRNGITFENRGFGQPEKINGMSAYLPEKINALSVQLTLAPTTPVTIKVVNEEGEPLPGVKVAPSEILEEGATPHYMTMLESFMDSFSAADFCCARTNEEGIATLEFLPERFITRTRFSAYVPREGILHPDGRQTYYNATFRWMREPPEGQNCLEITLGKLARVKGTVKLADGTPVPWISIGVSDLHPYQPDMPGHRSGFTDVNGAYDLLVPPNDVYHFDVADNMLGIASRVLNFKVGDGNADTTLDFVLEKGIRLHGKVYGADGKPAVGEYNSRRYSDYHVVVLERKPKLEPDPYESPFLDDEDENDIWNTWVWDRDRNSYGTNVVDGKYECLLPTVIGEYSIRVSGGGYGSGGGHGLPREFSLNGGEDEYELDLYMAGNQQ